jgi:hypothetical protein
MRPFHPLLGFLWFHVKERLQPSLGLEPGRIFRVGGQAAARVSQRIRLFS